MKDRLINVLKWFFIAMGVLFFATILLFIAIVIFANTFKIESVPEIKQSKFNLKEMKKIVDYAENYKDKNGKYPEKVEDIKLNKNLEYKYTTSNDFDCYNIELKNTKSNSTKQYQHCRIKKDGLSSNSESFSEVK